MGTIDPKDIERAAALLIEVYGDGAAAQAKRIELIAANEGFASAVRAETERRSRQTAGEAKVASGQVPTVALDQRFVAR